MIDYTDKESLRQFLEDNDIRDTVQLNMLFRQITGVLLGEMLEAERGFLHIPRKSIFQKYAHGTILSSAL